MHLDELGLRTRTNTLFCNLGARMRPHDFPQIRLVLSLLSYHITAAADTRFEALRARSPRAMIV
jgi:hypothetical protein